MQCPNCGKTGFVNLSGRRYCSNCGSKLDQSGTHATMSDIKPSGKPLDLRSKPTEAVVSPAATAKPAGQLHGHQVASGVLDLRAKPAPSDAPVTPVVAAPPALPTPPTPLASITPKPTQISKPTLEAAAPSAVAPMVDTPMSTTTTTKSPLIDKFSKPEQALPNAVAAQVDMMQQTPAVPPPTPVAPSAQSPALQQALAAAKHSADNSSVIKLGAAVTAVAVMVGVIWLQNSPKLAFHNAAAKAGIEASLPTYIPSSYRQSGDAVVAAGQLTLQYNSPSADVPLTIVQKRSDWDTNSLRENYINRQTNSFLAIQGQGLTIYLYGDHASWINHGVWYEVTGVSKLTREQILKVAYGL